MEHERISRESLFMGMSILMSRRSTCKRGQVGAVITQDNRVVSTGYNGPLKGLAHCSEKECDLKKSCIRAVHAEANAIYAAAKNGIKLDEATLYTTHRPCEKCFQAIAASGIKSVYFCYDYHTDDKESDAIIRMFIDAGIELHKLEEGLITE